MRVAVLASEDDFDGWRDAARTLAGARVPPGEIVWQVGDMPGDLFGDEAVRAAAAPVAFSVPRGFLDLAKTVVLHADPQRFALLYALLVRLIDQPRLIDDRADPALRALEEMAKAVRRDIHKMRAFLRFRELPHQPAPPPGHPQDDMGGRVEERANTVDPEYVAWFEPEHHIVRANAQFFVNRFTAMRWSILTPALSIHWDGEVVSEAPGAVKADAPDGDPTEEVWKTYYASIFNPARVKIGAMLKEMPRKYWKNMPETALVPGLIAQAQRRESGMIETARTAQGGNVTGAWEALRDEAMGCQRCPLWKPATQTVFGEGPVDARMMFVGEQPGDQEDLAGRPFVGPAGQVFDAALGEAGIDRATVYVTNAVKHFKFEPRGKRRIHSKPNAGEIDACRWWVEQETMLVQPRLTVALGATAARSLTGRTVTIGRERGRGFELPGGGTGFITVHPSFLLRIDDPARAEDERGRFVVDLRAAAALVVE
ncbi:UdgX family uracil-DNA binding protein [Sphingomonas japonica]|uniref:Type-4 uracil-DNA glycosylase n=1 Tax=Sphingomonas japonica TaxID=511662 RepID=A0ABX0TZ07_9SPHN|nr:UdgX family uracil-DNA binding protein [Sphingomonas japonica]NIJ23550.1 DNA polymerase [Sphingomonas japonica]